MKGLMGGYGVALIVAVSVLSLRTSSEQLSSRECENLGFTGLALCSDCNTLSQYVKDEELVSDCLKCCTEDSDDATTKITYSGALLEVCMRKLVFYPEVVSFIEEEKDQFPSVKVQYVFNSPPKLIMLDDEGQQKETIRELSVDMFKILEMIEADRQENNTGFKTLEIAVDTLLKQNIGNGVNLNRNAEGTNSRGNVGCKPSSTHEQFIAATSR
ncbi:hypothetical protein V8G54_001522 [Vigna mungo]|uniref:Selenoprotein F n=1 Tax=Vigna mungo TaxID=3915 RepID=A0AAQ3P7I9_VIGMU